jgi:hypothetical protein
MNYLMHHMFVMMYVFFVRLKNAYSKSDQKKSIQPWICVCQTTVILFCGPYVAKVWSTN